MAGNRKKLDKLHIIQWNIQGLRARYQELRSILYNNKILVACLQETLLGDSQWQPSKQFKIEKSPHLGGGSNRGVALLLHSSLQYTRIRLFTTIEAVAATVHTGKELTICSIYLSPNLNIERRNS